MRYNLDTSVVNNTSVKVNQIVDCNIISGGTV